MMLHHLDSDAKTAAAAAAVFRVLRPGGRLPRLTLRSPLAAGNLGDTIPRVLRSVGFDCAEVDTHVQRFVGRLTYYRAVRPF
jgi:hypothetical protein